MATSKTLAPTNVTISIPAMTDQPNASVLANCADKEADAINALNSQIASVPYIKHYNGTSLTVALPKYASGFCAALVAGIGSCSFTIYRSANYIVKDHLSGEQNATNAITVAVADDTTVTLSASGARIEITTILSNLL